MAKINFYYYYYYYLDICRRSKRLAKYQDSKRNVATVEVDGKQVVA